MNHSVQVEMLMSLADNCLVDTARVCVVFCVLVNTLFGNDFFTSSS